VLQALPLVLMVLINGAGKLWHFESVPSLVNHFKSILVLPYTMSLIAEPWFYSDLSSQEAIQMLTNQHGGA